MAPHVPPLTVVLPMSLRCGDPPNEPLIRHTCAAYPFGVPSEPQDVPMVRGRFRYVRQARVKGNVRTSTAASSIRVLRLSAPVNPGRAGPAEIDQTTHRNLFSIRPSVSTKKIPRKNRDPQVFSKYRGPLTENPDAT